LDKMMYHVAFGQLSRHTGEQEGTAERDVQTVGEHPVADTYGTVGQTTTPDVEGGLSTMQKMIRLRLVLLVILGAVASACATDKGQLVPLSAPIPLPASFSHRAASADVELLWNCSQPRPEALRLAGAARNIGQRDVQSVGLTVRSLRAGEMPILLTAEALPNVMLYGRDLSPFQIDLPLEKTPSRIDLSGEYQWTPNPNSPTLSGPPEGLTVEDACAPTRHPNTVSR
jgi:hypothetical protein